MQTVENLEQEVENPRHDCPAFGKNAIVPRAYNTAEPEKTYFRCPMCSYTVETLKERQT